MKNQNFAIIAATGLPVRFASQHGGVARVYAGNVFEEFMSNKNRAAVLETKAPDAHPRTHLGRALERLAARTNELYQAIAEHQAAELRAMMPAAESTKAARL
jgi:hypothetical protein